MSHESSNRQRVLVVDDEPTIRYALERMLSHEGLEVLTAENGEEGLSVFYEEQPDIVLLDIKMPKLNGFQVCERIKADVDHRLTPVIIVTSSSEEKNRIRGLEAGADDFLSKPFERIELTARVRSMLRIKRYTDELERAETVLFALAQSIEGKDPYTQGHCERLSTYAEALGRKLGLPEDELTALRRAGIVHDIGKVAVPDAVLLKPGRLDEAERKIINEHPVIGEKICRGLKSFKLVLPIIRHHHEKLDGTGYPDGLSGDEIPHTARILTIVDVFDALTTERPYKRAYTTEEALQIMQEETDRGWWDPNYFAIFRELMESGQFARVEDYAACASSADDTPAT